jgi:uncharacterized DUF497 family protein
MPEIRTIYNPSQLAYIHKCVLLGRHKARTNLKKHGVSFEEAARIFVDPDALDWDDPEHSYSEQRSKRLGSSLTGRILIVVYTQRRLKHGQGLIRIISARQATRQERQAYTG